MNRLRVSVLSADVPADRDRWSALGEHLDAYYTAGHASALAGVEGGLAYAYLARDAWGSQVLYPFVRRDLTRLEYIGQEGQGLSDITTPYGVWRARLCRGQLPHERDDERVSYCIWQLLYHRRNSLRVRAVPPVARKSRV